VSDLIKSAEEIQRMHRAGKLLAACHREIARRIRPGITTQEIDQFVESYLAMHGATPEQKGYMGYPYATCTSVNDVVCHGMPNTSPLQDGDIVTIDMVVNLDGWLADSAWSYSVGTISSEKQRLLDTTLEALEAGIRQARVGNRIGHISHAIQTLAESKGYSVVRQFIGHGIGTRIHEDPPVPHFGEQNSGIMLLEGMVITIEPMLNIGSPEVRIDPDGWTARTADGSLSAQYEHTVAITRNGPLVLTEQ
jgi:methionyl aminopeptidase